MASGTCFTDFPDIVLLEIFSNLSIEDLAMSVQHVNSHWKNVSQDGSLWKNKTFSPERKLNDEEIVRYLMNMPALRAYSRNEETNTEVIVDALCKYCRDIRHIEFKWSSIMSNSALHEILKTFPNLETLALTVPEHLDQLPFRDLLGQFQNLRKVTFFDSGVTTIVDGILRTIADGCPSLQGLDIGFSEFQNQDIEYFLKTKRQQLLSFSFRTCLSTAAHKLLSECVNLEELFYEHFNEDLPDADIQLLSKLSKLRNLTLTHFVEGHTRNVSTIFKNQSLSKLTTLETYHCDDLDGTSFAVIVTNCPKLQSLMLPDCEITDCGFQYIGICKNLQFLDIPGCALITDKSMEYIGAGCPTLSHLNVAQCRQLTDKSIEYVCIGCQKLKYLNIQECPEMTDDVLKHICRSKKLNVLRLSGNSHFLGTHFSLIPSNLLNLTELHVHDCFSLDEKLMDKLKEELPHLKILGNYIKNGHT
jgi:hypothetical protein